MYFSLHCFKIQFYCFIVNCYRICFKLNLISNCFILLPLSFISFLFRSSFNLSLSITLIYFIALQFSSLSLIAYLNLICIVIIKNLKKKKTKIPIRNLTILDPKEVKELRPREGSLLVEADPLRRKELLAAPPLGGKTIVCASNCPFAQLVYRLSLSFYFNLFLYYFIYLSLQCK